MSRGAFGADDYVPPAETQPEAKKSPDHELLDEVLQHTLSVASDSEPLTAADQQALLEVARRHGDRLTSQGLIDLVKTVLLLRFGTVTKTRDYWERVAQDIAGTLQEDPLTSQRLESFWQKLCGAAG